MSRMVEKREYIQRTYTKYSTYIDKAVKFIIAFLMFTLVNQNIGFMKTMTSPIVAIVLAVVCALLPMNAMVLAVIAFALLHLYAMLPGVAAVATILFLIMFIFCFRIVPKQAVLLVLMPLAFTLKVPMLAPLICGLMYGPVCIFPMICGVVFYYMISYVESYTAILENAAELGTMGQITTYISQFLGSTEMWFVAAAFAICFIVVYNIRGSSIENAWEIAAITGSIVNMIVLLFISLDSSMKLSPVWVIAGTVISGILAIFLEFFAFPVDYSRTEHLQFEDDEYYYYVKAVPKVRVAAPKKTVKRITERRKTHPQTGRAARDRQDIALQDPFVDDIDLQKLLEEELNK